MRRNIGASKLSPDQIDLYKEATQKSDDEAWDPFTWVILEYPSIFWQKEFDTIMNLTVLFIC